MNSEKFVDLVRMGAKDSAVSELKSLLEDPPGRRPGKDLLVLSAWYKQLAEVEKSRVNSIIEMTSHHAVFGVLSILDGVRVVEPPERRGRFELVYVDSSGSERLVLNDPESAPLHEYL